MGLATNNKQKADHYFQSLTQKDSVTLRITNPRKDGLDGDVQEIYKQAQSHRNILVWFYVGYTVALSVAVVGLIVWQAYVRAESNNYTLELIPAWALDILVVGMFGQFIGLLAIVTKRVWEFKPFFDHAEHSKTSKSR